MAFQMRLVKVSSLTSARQVAARPAVARPRRQCVRAESPKNDQYNEPGPRPAGAPHESEGPTKGPASPRFQATEANYHPAGDSPKRGDVFPTVQSAVESAGNDAKVRADEAWEKMPTADEAQQQGKQPRRAKMDKERTSVENMVSDSEDMLPDNPISIDEDIIHSSKPFIKQLYKETAGTHDYSDMSSEEESEFKGGPSVADAVSDADDMLPDDPVDMDEEMILPQRPSIKAGGDPTDSPKAPQRDAIPGSAEQPSPPPPDTSERAQRMAEVEADVTGMGSNKQGSKEREGVGEGNKGAGGAEDATTSEKQAAEARAGLAATCWGRYEGILQAIDTLAAEEESPGRPKDSSAGAGQAAREESLNGGGEDGGDDELTREALSTMQPGDIMPRPGDKYLPHSMKPHERPDQGPAARLNKPHSGPFKQTVTTPPSTAGLMPAASAPRSPSGRMVARAEPQQADSRAPGAADAADTVKLDNYNDQMELSAVPGGDQAVSGSDLETKALDTDDQAGVGVDDEELFPIEKDALKGSDAMYYFKSDDKPSLQEASPPKAEQQSSFRAAMETVEGSLKPQQEQPQQAKQSSRQQARGGDHKKQDRAEEPRRESVIRSLQNQANHLASPAQQQQHRHHRPNPLQATQTAAREAQQQLSSTASRTVEVALGRSALLGLASSLVSEVLTNQSVLSQLLGRYEGGLQVEHPVHLAQQAAMVVVLACLALTAGEELATWRLAPSWKLLGLGPGAQVGRAVVCAGDGDGDGPSWKLLGLGPGAQLLVLVPVLVLGLGMGMAPSWKLLGLGPGAQLWLGRLGMLVFAALLVSESLHSNRPAFSTLFYTFF
ncbi:hypothetical protein N2152v2_005652 [Parachlorella kessleri]